MCRLPDSQAGLRKNGWVYTQRQKDKSRRMAGSIVNTLLTDCLRQNE